MSDDPLLAVRHAAMETSFGERLQKQERKILTNMLSKLNTLTGQDALVGLHTINELRKLQKGMERETKKAIQELEDVTRE